MISRYIILCFFLFLSGCKQDKTRVEQAEKSISQSDLLSVNKYLSDKEKDIIEHFIRRQDWKMEFSEDGYFYEIQDPGSGPRIKEKQYVEYEYTIKQLNGTLCYTSKRKGTQKLIVAGGGEEISGIHLAIRYLGKGGKARFIFPPQLAHGLMGDMDKIPPRAILVYELQIIDVE